MYPSSNVRLHYMQLLYPRLLRTFIVQFILLHSCYVLFFYWSKLKIYENTKLLRMLRFTFYDGYRYVGFNKLLLVETNCEELAYLWCECRTVKRKCNPWCTGKYIFFAFVSWHKLYFISYINQSSTPVLQELYGTFTQILYVVSVTYQCTVA